MSNLSILKAVAVQEDVFLFVRGVQRQAGSGRPGLENFRPNPEWHFLFGHLAIFYSWLPSTAIGACLPLLKKQMSNAALLSSYGETLRSSD